MMNRRKMLSLLGLSPALLAGAAGARANPTSGENASSSSVDKEGSSNGGRAGSSGVAKITAFNPKGTPPAIQLIPMAPRLDALDGKTIYLVDTGFMGGGYLLQQMQVWFGKNMPSVKTVFKRKAGPYAEDDPALWQEIKTKGNAAIMAIGH